jgi:gamma-glutamyltranspeptidase/glutathione hydrolase
VTEADLASQRAEWVEPIGLGYRGRQILEMPPNGQGIVALVALGILAFEDLGSLSPADRMHLEIEATRIGFEEAELRVGDPRCVEVDVDSLLTESALSRLRHRIDRRAARTARVGTSPHGDTTYFCVVDAAVDSCSGSVHRSSRTSPSAIRCRGQNRPRGCESSCSRSGPSGIPGPPARRSSSAASSTRTR